jgi:L-alanine-DL-glutamate epimerase-like enolase superfamily enzyme
MRITEFSVHAIRIPLRFSFSHNLSNRFQAESIVVRISDEKGNLGYGEGAPRNYVTGEDLLSCSTYLNENVLPWILKREWNSSISNTEELLYFLKEFHDDFPNLPSKNVVVWNAARTSVELALIDCLMHRLGASFNDFFPLKRKTLIFGTGVGAYSPMKSSLLALGMYAFGFRNFKIKLKRLQDTERIERIRNILGSKVQIRLDANSAYNFRLSSDIHTLHAFKKFNIISIEQPFEQGHHREIAAIKQDIGIPIMADESLLHMDNAIEIIREKSYDALNLRVSRVGGIYPFMQMANLAKENGIWFQIGCHVGELAILSRVGQLLAGYYSDVEHLEGGYGTLLLDSDLEPNSQHIGYGGKINIQSSLSFGYSIDEKILRKYSSIQ